MDFSNIDIKLARAATLPILPDVVAQVLAMSDDPNLGTRAYEKVLSQDAALTAKLLRTANSSYYCGNGEVTTLQKALARLGINTIRSICITVAMQSAMATKNLDPRFHAGHFWQHSMAVACGAKILACLTHFPQPEEAFIAGLLHDIGKLAMALYLTQEMQQVYARVSAGHLPDLQTEITYLGVTHQQIGRLAAERWQLPALYMAPIANHHDPRNEGGIEQLTALVHVANILAHEIELGFGGTNGGQDRVADPDTVAFLGLPAAQWDPLRATVYTEVARVSASIHV